VTFLTGSIQKWQFKTPAQETLPAARPLGLGRVLMSKE
jgi:hypothetical protein